MSHQIYTAEFFYQKSKFEIRTFNRPVLGFPVVLTSGQDDRFPSFDKLPEEVAPVDVATNFLDVVESPNFELFFGGRRQNATPIDFRPTVR